MKLALLALAFAAAIAFTAVANSYYVFIMATLALTAVAGIGLNVLLGLTGQVSFGHVGFYALGAYAVAVLTVAAKWNFWLALPVAALLAAAIGALLALPVAAALLLLVREVWVPKQDIT
jgi:ABC-type branched-subunit amino acid transport system permease subunit